MHVTNYIRDYVTEYIRKKYNEKINEYKKDYNEETKELKDKIDEIIERAKNEIMEEAQKRNFEYNKDTWCDKIISVSGKFVKQEEEKRVAKYRTEINEKMKEKTDKVLFELEMGKTAKDELMKYLDELTID